jgi:photosystem II stability/assembly factor-like uncharacterized protein
MRLALALALAGVLVSVTAASARDTTRGVPGKFRPGSVAAVGTRDLWVLGEYPCGTSTWCNALVRSTDAGKQFTQVAFPPFPSQGTSPSVVFANTRDGFAYVQDGTPLFVTRDGGSSWRRTGPAGNVSAFAVGGGDAYVVTSRRIYERTPVAKDAWRALRLPPFKRGFVVSLAVHGSRVWLLGTPERQRKDDSDEIALSRNRGANLAARPGPCYAELGGRLTAAGAGVVWAVCPTGMMAGLWLSKDGGRSFPSLHSARDRGALGEPGLTNGAEIVATSAKDAVLYPGAQGPLYRTTDEGRRWARVRQTARFGDVFSLDFSTRRVGVLVAPTLHHPSRPELWRTTDGGATWQPLLLPLAHRE